MLDDMPKNQDFFKEIVFFDEQFNGIVPLQIIVDTKRKGVKAFKHYIKTRKN